VDTVHECDGRTDRQTDGQTELRSQRPCNAERRTVKTLEKTRKIRLTASTFDLINDNNNNNNNNNDLDL